VLLFILSQNIGQASSRYLWVIFCLQARSFLTADCRFTIAVSLLYNASRQIFKKVFKLTTVINIVRIFGHHLIVALQQQHTISSSPVAITATTSTIITTTR
jgi:hypothetical protein